MEKRNIKNIFYSENPFAMNPVFYSPTGVAHGVMMKLFHCTRSRWKRVCRCHWHFFASMKQRISPFRTLHNQRLWDTKCHWHNNIPSAWPFLIPTTVSVWMRLYHGTFKLLMLQSNITILCLKIPGSCWGNLIINMRHMELQKILPSADENIDHAPD